MFFRRHPYRVIALALLLSYLTIAAGYVGASSWWIASHHWHVEFRDALIPRINDVALFTFFLVCGASVGSFLNVVVWRLPQGLGVNGHSFCPRCRNQLRARDNVPVFGWLWLGGRCRDCRLPISSRYPIVEAAVAMSFAVVGFGEVMGMSLPYALYGWQFDRLAMPIVETGTLVTTLFHLVGIAIVWAMGLIRYDGNRIPSRLIGFAVVWLIGGMLLLPALAVVPWQLSVPVGWPPEFGWEKVNRLDSPAWMKLLDVEQIVQAAVRILTALAAAGFLARSLARGFCVGADLKLDPLGTATGRLVDLVVLLSAVAVLVGWQASLGVLLVASFLGRWSGCCLRSDALGRFGVAIPLALVLQLVGWKVLVESGVWPSEQAPRGVLLFYAFVVLCIPFWLSETRPGVGDVCSTNLDMDRGMDGEPTDAEQSLPAATENDCRDPDDSNADPAIGLD